VSVTDGNVAGWFTDDTPKRFEAYGWNVIAGVDGHDGDAVDAAIRAAKRQQAGPTLICCKTTIGHGAPAKAGGHDVHGAPLGPDEILSMRAAKNWPHEQFTLPEELMAEWDGRVRGGALEQEWNRLFERYQAAHGDLAAELLRRKAGALPLALAGCFDALLAGGGELQNTVATRKASQIVLEAISATLPELFGGSADLTGSNLTEVRASVRFNDHGAGNYLSYGVREFGMAAIMNGMALYGGFIPYGGTFMTFSDYSRNAIRMAALMKQRVIHVLTHDSIGLGEDGPTHQPVEHAAALRLIPNNRLWRPCDGVETAVAWRQALARSDGPACLSLSRQALQPFQRSAQQIEAIARGGYVLQDCDAPDIVLIATGSEVGVAALAAELLRSEGRKVRLVSMPCVEIFQVQDAAYRAGVLPPGVPRVSVEAGVTWFWRGVVGDNGVALGMDTFGESAPAADLYRHFGLTPAHVAASADALIRS
jgi:transketolase